MTPSIPVLYAEDNPSDADLTRTHFEEYAPDFTIDVVHRGEEFMKRARTGNYALFLIDQRLPDMEGIDILRALVQEGIQTPKVMVTGIRDSEVASQALKLGADDYVPKRIGYLDMLAGQLRDVLERRRRFPVPGMHLKPHRVLLIDDNPVDARLAMAHLALNAPHLMVENVGTPSLALQRLENGAPYDLIVCDFNLPERDGLDLMREIRRSHRVPFIMVTATSSEEAVVSALKLGASDYLLKHERNFAELGPRIELAIDRHRLVLANERISHQLAERQRTLAALRESDTQLNLALDAGRIGLWSWDVNSKSVKLSPRWKAQLGYTDAEFSDDSAAWEAHCHPDDLPHMQELVSRYLTAPWPDYTLEYRMRHKNGEWRWFLLRADLERDANGHPSRMFGSQIDITELKQQQAELARASSALQQLSRRLLEVQETERRHLARELHDEIGQMLTATKIHLQSLGLQPENQRLATQVRDAVGLLDTLLAQVRSLSLNLRPPLLDDLGLGPALTWLSQQSRDKTPRVQLSVPSSVRRYDPMVETACFRIAQEAVTNALRHAQAKTITLQLAPSPAGLTLKVKDDGKGFEVNAARARAEKGSSLGILGMNERALFAGGKVTLESKPGSGTQVTAFFPLSETAATS